MRNRRRLSLAAVALLLLGLALGPLGCRLLRLGTLGQEPAPPREPQGDLPGKHQFRVSQYHFHADFPVNQKLPIFQELAELREQVLRELQLPPSTTLVKVYLFEKEERYQQFMRGRWPHLPPRPAFFVAQPRVIGGGEDLLVYTYWGEKVNQDLRHELTHALLHCVLKDVPLWLDEGLAEYFETPPGSGGINYKHLDHLRRGGPGPFRPDLARLEELTEVAQMNPAEYRESWAWVHWMLQGSPEARRALIGYLHDLRTNAQPGKLRPRLLAAVPGANESLTRHLTAIDGALARPLAGGP